MLDNEKYIREQSRGMDLCRTYVDLGTAIDRDKIISLHHLSDAADEGGSNPVSVQIFSASPSVQYFHQKRMYELQSLFSFHKLIV